MTSTTLLLGQTIETAASEAESRAVPQPKGTVSLGTPRFPATRRRGPVEQRVPQGGPGPGLRSWSPEAAPPRLTSSSRVPLSADWLVAAVDFPLPTHSTRTAAQHGLLGRRWGIRPSWGRSDPPRQRGVGASSDPGRAVPPAAANRRMTSRGRGPESREFGRASKNSSNSCPVFAPIGVKKVGRPEIPADTQWG